MIDLQLEKHGIITEGQYEGYYVRFHDDSEVTGGFYIFLVNDLDLPTDGADYWVENMVELESFAESAEWKIRWID